MWLSADLWTSCMEWVQQKDACLGPVLLQGTFQMKSETTCLIEGATVATKSYCDRYTV